ncbi:MAG: phosphonate transport system permease protein [Candidatus Paceibacteria bacterium]|jgi:phosphonate transport system permease protein
MSMSTLPNRLSEIERLRRERPRSRLLRITLWALTLWSLYAWLSPEIGLLEFLDQRRFSNLSRFVKQELVPFPLRAEGAGLADLMHWLSSIWGTIGAQSTRATLQISILAIVLAALGAAPLSLLTARNFASATPFETQTGRASRALRLFWWAVTGAARALAILLRAVPEFILAFLLLAVLGPQTAWPAILALAIHNGGILARLGGEVIENLEPAPLRTLMTHGSSRSSSLVFGVVPLGLSRNLLYLFYRFETCVREATVLGMLGVVSLGYWIQDARAKQYYDEVFLLVLFSIALVMLADLISALARYSLRR